MAKSLSDLTGKKRSTDKPNVIVDHQRILDGNPFTRKGVDEIHLTAIPAPVDVRECREQPARGWEIRSHIGANGKAISLWYHPYYAERARMWQFQIRQDSAVDKYNRAVFSDPRIKD